MPSLTTTQSVGGRLSGLAHLHTVARQERSLQFNNLLHHITPELLERAYKSLNRTSAKGIDNESWLSFGENLPERIQDVHQRIQRQQYKPQPVRRIWLPKPNGEKRPIGITAVEYYRCACPSTNQNLIPPQNPAVRLASCLKTIA